MRKIICFSILFLFGAALNVTLATNRTQTEMFYPDGFKVSKTEPVTLQQINITIDNGYLSVAEIVIVEKAPAFCVLFVFKSQPINKNPETEFSIDTGPDLKSYCINKNYLNKSQFRNYKIYLKNCCIRQC